MDIISGGAAAFALTAGILAAFNPCGFAVLPAYLTIIVTGSSEQDSSRIAALRRAMSFSLGMTLGFIAVFTGFGVMFAGVSLGLQGDILPYLSYVTAALGVVLVYIGARMAMGHEPSIPGLRVQGVAPTVAFWSQVGYGATFALASMSCTIGPFLAVVTGALDAPNPLGVGLPFIIYGMGMGTSVMVVSLIAALAGSTVVLNLRRRTPVVMRIAGYLLIAAGLYVAAFGLAEILPRYGVHAFDGLLLTTSHWQGSVTQAISSWGTTVLIVITVLVAILTLWLWRRARRAAENGSTRL